jgi:hypothetical protein
LYKIFSAYSRCVMAFTLTRWNSTGLVLCHLHSIYKVLLLPPPFPVRMRLDVFHWSLMYHLQMPHFNIPVIPLSRNSSHDKYLLCRVAKIFIFI